MFNYTYKTTISGEIQINNFYLNEFKSRMSCKYGGKVSLMVSQGISEAWSEKNLLAQEKMTEETGCQWFCHRVDYGAWSQRILLQKKLFQPQHS